MKNLTVNLEEEILLAKGYNWAKIIAEKCDRIANEMSDRDDLFIKMLSGEIFQQAQKEFAEEKTKGMYDEMNVPVEYSL